MTVQAYQILKKAGPLRNGWERGKGSIYHAVPTGFHGDANKALCGQYPAIMWSSEPGDELTCPRCKRLAHGECGDQGKK